MSVGASENLPAEDLRAARHAEGRFFYGWVIVAVTFLAQFVVMGTVFYSYGVLLKPLTADLGVSRFLIGLGLPALMVVAGIAGPFIGHEVDRRPIRALMGLGAVLLAAGFLGLSRATSVWHLYFYFGGFIALGMALLGGMTNTALVANWFVRRRGTAIGISQIGVSLSGFVMAYVTTALVVAYGWRTTSVVFGIVPLVLVMPVLWLLVVNRPEDRGLAPDGDPVLPPDPEAAPGTAPVAWTRILGVPALWIIALIVGFTFAANGAVIQVIHSHVTDLGHAPAQAATVLGFMAGMAAVGKACFGWLADRTSKRGSMALCLVVQASGLVLLFAASSYPALVAAGLVFGLGYGGVLPLWAILLGAVFPREVFGRAMGLTGPVMLPFQIVGLPLATWIFDHTGSYRSAFVIFLGFYGVAALLLGLLRLPRTPRAP